MITGGGGAAIWTRQYRHRPSGSAPMGAPQFGHRVGGETAGDSTGRPGATWPVTHSSAEAGIHTCSQPRQMPRPAGASAPTGTRIGRLQ